mgnify:CR=1 FL=1
MWELVGVYLLSWPELQAWIPLGSVVLIYFCWCVSFWSQTTYQTCPGDLSVRMSATAAAPVGYTITNDIMWYCCKTVTEYRGKVAHVLYLVYAMKNFIINLFSNGLSVKTLAMWSNHLAPKTQTWIFFCKKYQHTNEPCSMTHKIQKSWSGDLDVGCRIKRSLENTLC